MLGTIHIDERRLVLDRGMGRGHRKVLRQSLAVPAPCLVELDYLMNQVVS